MTEETPADVQSGMIMKVLRDSPMRELNSCVLHPGTLPTYPESWVLLINRSDFEHFASEIINHDMSLSRLTEDDFGNTLYAIEDRQIVIKS